MARHGKAVPHTRRATARESVAAPSIITERKFKRDAYLRLRSNGESYFDHGIMGRANTIVQSTARAEPSDNGSRAVYYGHTLTEKE